MKGLKKQNVMQVTNTLMDLSSKIFLCPEPDTRYVKINLDLQSVFHNKYLDSVERHSHLVKEGSDELD